MKTKKVRLDVEWAQDAWTPKITVGRFALPVPRVSPLPFLPVSHRCYTLSTSSLFTSRGTRGFTLIEMLVVIGIIGILAAILLPAVAGAKQRAKVAAARTEMANLITAITGYETEYSRPPASKEVEAQIDPNKPDFTYGTERTHPPKDILVPGGNGTQLSVVKNDMPYTFEADNSLILNILMNRDVYPNKNFARNPRRIVNFTSKEGKVGDPGLDPDGILRDPWGHPYIITIDMNEDNLCKDAYYSPRPEDAIPGQVIVWSLGKDGAVNLPSGTTPPNNTGANRNNVLSWRQ